MSFDGPVKVNDQELTLGSEARSPAMNVSFQKQAFPGSDFGHWEGIPTVIIAVQEFTVKVIHCCLLPKNTLKQHPTDESVLLHYPQDCKTHHQYGFLPLSCADFLQC